MHVAIAKLSMTWMHILYLPNNRISPGEVFWFHNQNEFGWSLITTGSDEADYILVLTVSNWLTVYVQKLIAFLQRWVAFFSLWGGEYLA